MKVFEGKVTVITGAASGIGRGLVERCVKEKMKIVLADIDDKGLRRIERKLKRDGIPVIAVLTDVSKAEDIEILAQKTVDSFGEVHLLFNNAGVAIPRLTWEYTLRDWEHILGVNLWGVIHGIRTFVPKMIAQDNDCHIVNTSSIEGLLSTGIGGATYGVAKHGLVFLSERLALEFEENAPKIKVSVLCPGFVRTKIFSTALNRLLEYRSDIEFWDNKERIEKLHQFIEESPGILPENVADIVFQAIEEEKLYIFTHSQPVIKNKVKERMDAILSAFDQFNA